jgi:hypothetical protein
MHCNMVGVLRTVVPPQKFKKCLHALQAHGNESSSDSTIAGVIPTRLLSLKYLRRTAVRMELITSMGYTNLCNI